MIAESNIIHRDSKGAIRKWIDQETGDVMEDEHTCRDFVSQCCGAGRHEYVESICGECLDHTGFECIDCNTLEEEN